MRTRLVILVVVVAAAAAAGAAFLILRGHRSGTLTIEVDGHRVQVVRGTTLGEASAELGLHAPAGSLLAVDGSVLRAGAFPGRVLLDGRRAAPGTPLRAGDRVAFVPGRSRREGLSRQVLRLPEGLPGDPQFFLSRTPGRQIVVRGAVSHKLVSARFVPEGAPAAERAVALTFDDGPSPQYTPKILAVLRRLHVHATFFVIGYLAETYPQLVRAELRAGMTVGNHTYNHPEVPPFDALPQQLLVDEIELGAQSLERAGARPVLFRPPGGSFSAAVVAAARQAGERLVLWSVDPVDWQAGATATGIARAVLSAVKPGSIVELHDGGGDRSATLEALPAIVRGIRHRGLRLVAIT